MTMGGKEPFRVMRTAAMLVACVGIFVAPKMAAAAVANGYVATVNGSNEFVISADGTRVDYNVQPDTEYNWYDSDGDLVTYERNGVEANRDGMKTFAATDAAFGETIGSLVLQFDYATSSLTNSDGYPYGNNPTINICITDGAGTYAIWSATSGGTGFTTTDLGTGWAHLTLDCTSFAVDSVYGKINESTNTSILVNGNLNSTAVQWSDISDWTVAGFYNEQFFSHGRLGGLGRESVGRPQRGRQRHGREPVRHRPDLGRHGGQHVRRRRQQRCRTHG